MSNSMDFHTSRPLRAEGSIRHRVYAPDLAFVLQRSFLSHPVEPDGHHAVRGLRRRSTLPVAKFMVQDIRLPRLPHRVVPPEFSEKPSLITMAFSRLCYRNWTPSRPCWLCIFVSSAMPRTQVTCGKDTPSLLVKVFVFSCRYDQGYTTVHYPYDDLTRVGGLSPSGGTACSIP